jgi:SAM-dependent methyltransferase
MIPDAMPARDVFQRTDDLEPATLAALGERLEFRGTDATFSRMRNEYFDRLPLAAARAVLDVGCGTGAEVRALLRRPGFTGRLVAVDQSPGLIETARRLASEEGLEERVDYRLGDAHRLDLPDGAFDVAIAHTLLSHVADPTAALREMARVVRPGGAVAVFDGDFASWAWAHPDPALAAAMNEALIATVVANPLLMRQLPRSLHDLGLRLVEAQPNLYAEVGTGHYFLGAAESYAPLLAASGLVPAEDVQRWLEDQRRAVAEGTFFASCNYYAYIAERA